MSIYFEKDFFGVKPKAKDISKKLYSTVKVHIVNSNIKIQDTSK
jgi:hypothetical protein